LCREIKVGRQFKSARPGHSPEVNGLKTAASG